MKNKLRLILILLVFNGLHTSIAQTNAIVNNDVVFEEVDGLVAIEAEHFYKQSKNEVRQWYRFSKDENPDVGRDDDFSHCHGASNNSYLEILPDTRVTHSDEIISGINFSNEQGEMAFLHYKVQFNNPGKYYVWVRAFSTGSEDNGIHVGLNGEWPESGARMQWCEGKNTWTWESKQRTEEVHCGEPYLIYLDIDKAGEHEIMFSMREDGFEFDKFIMTTDKNYTPEGTGPLSKVKTGTLPEPFPEAVKKSSSYKDAFEANEFDNVTFIKATEFPVNDNDFYVDQDKWLAVDPGTAKEGTTSITYNGNDVEGSITVLGVGENDGGSTYTLLINDKEVGKYTALLSMNTTEENAVYCKSFENISLKKGDKISVHAKIGSSNDVDNSRARWAGIVISENNSFLNNLATLMPKGAVPPAFMNVLPEISGELKKWHKVTFTFDGPESAEDADFNPFMNYRFNVEFTHKATGAKYLVPGYFAADGNAGNTSSTRGNKWRVHFAPDEIGEWEYNVDFVMGNFAAVSDRPAPGKPAGYMNKSFGSFKIAASDKSGDDFRGKGRLQYVGERYLKFAETGEYFLKVGSDAPENFLSYEEFDGTFHNDGHKDDLVKAWAAHEKHWNEGDPTWKDGKGKDIIGAVNYLHSKGMNAFSFLTNNIAGDDQNVFPYVDYDTYDRMDCSKLDQWEVIFEHADELGMFLHFKTLEFENQGLLDNGGVGANSKIYYRELIARFGHHLALNWNMCEESGDWTNSPPTPPQFTMQRLSMAAYFAKHDPYNHHRVIHNGEWYTDIYGPNSEYTGASLQTWMEDFSAVHEQTLKIINESKAAGKQWAVACDEPGDHRFSLVPDNIDSDHDNARMNGLWGHFMAGGWGTEWYFGYANEHSDLSCQDYASRDKFWDQGKIALDFFSNNQIPYWEMESHDEMVLNDSDYAFAKSAELYVFYLKKGEAKVDLSSAAGKLSVMWFNPRTGGELQSGSVKTVKAAAEVDLGTPPTKDGKDWVVLVKSLK